MRSACGRRWGRAAWPSCGQFLIEALILSTAGGVFGAVVAYWGVRALVRTAPVEIPRMQSIAIDGRVLLFSAPITVSAAVLFSLVPAFWLSRRSCLRRHLLAFSDYYHRSRTHLSLQKDTPDKRPIQRASAGTIVAIPGRWTASSLRTSRCVGAARRSVGNCSFRGCVGRRRLWSFDRADAGHSFSARSRRKM
jgi:hypothetical protein